MGTARMPNKTGDDSLYLFRCDCNKIIGYGKYTVRIEQFLAQ